MNYFDAIILGIVEGITEFLPISSTGHMILVSNILGIGEDAFVKTFEISIQLGAIMAIVLLYAGRFLSSVELYKKLIIAFFPTALVGFFLYKTIKTYLFSPMVVSIALIIGGIILVILDKRMKDSKEPEFLLENMSYRKAFMIGTAQSISVIPGVSRAAATIIGGMFSGLSKKQAMEFSFLLAVPTMCAATGYDLLKTPIHFSGREFFLLGVGAMVSFIFAYLAVKIFLRTVERYGFGFFGYYRIALGILFLLFFV
ncbi:MAG: undecaprenyl-diphosphatase UppP [uncultured bacterium]|nr:MAG: undecaprenyl-diphosphatase UppP [uncultured bacterium]HCU70123.1 UDP-diphosphatase [Candidatus Moranbacteria bacterium]